MIDKAIDFLKDELNAYLKLNVGDEYGKTVKSANILNQDGTVEATLEDSIIATLINVQEERITKAQGYQLDTINGQQVKLNPEIKLNLFILFTANFKNYNESLKFLSHLISFFQSKNVFDPKNSPALHVSIEKLIADLHTISFEQQNNLWGSLGAKYMPSVVFKVRLIVVQERKALKTSETISGFAPGLSRS